MRKRAMRWGDRWRSLSSRERARLGAIVAAIALLNAAGWGLFVLAILPRHVHYRGLGVGIGVAFTAWTLGLRHAFDADHIAVIDNTTRKLMADGQRPLGTGFFFALGHSMIIMVVGTAITIAARSAFRAVVAPSSTFQSTGGVIGTAVSGTFLYALAAINVVALVGILKVFRDLRRGAVVDDERLEAQLLRRGLMARLLGRLTRSIAHTWQLFFVGLVLGVGFDTATEVLLLAGTAAAATAGLPWYAVLALPLLFAGGMTLCDTLDGLFMNVAYGWAFARPARKLFYNIAVTGLSIAVAFVIATIEIAGLLATELHLHGWLGDYMANFDINRAGFIIAALFAVFWAAALVVWRYGSVGRRFDAGAELGRGQAAPALATSDDASGGF